MSTITKERLEPVIERLEHYATNVKWTNVQAAQDMLTAADAMRRLLASLEAEAAITVGDDGGDALAYRRLIQTFAPGTKLYTAPPAPVSVMDEAQSRELFEKNCMANIERNKWHPDLYAHLPAREQWAAWEACRNAMLHGADGTLTNEGTITATQFKPVADLYGLTSPTGGETSFTFDAVEARDFIDGGWSCQEYVQLERFQEAVSGNSPVIPDEALSAIRKVARIRADFDDFDGDRRGIGDCLDEAEQELIVTINKHASVIAAAPQQEVAQALAKGMERYGDAMQKLADSGD